MLEEADSNKALVANKEAKVDFIIKLGSELEKELELKGVLKSNVMMICPK